MCRIQLLLFGIQGRPGVGNLPPAVFYLHPRIRKLSFGILYLPGGIRKLLLRLCFSLLKLFSRFLKLLIRLILQTVSAYHGTVIRQLFDTLKNSLDLVIVCISKCKLCLRALHLEIDLRIHLHIKGSLRHNKECLDIPVPHRRTASSVRQVTGTVPKPHNLQYIRLKRIPDIIIRSGTKLNLIPDPEFRIVIRQTLSRFLRQTPLAHRHPVHFLLKRHDMKDLLFICRTIEKISAVRSFRPRNALNAFHGPDIFLRDTVGTDRLDVHKLSLIKIRIPAQPHIRLRRSYSGEKRNSKRNNKKNRQESALTLSDLHIKIFSRGILYLPSRLFCRPSHHVLLYVLSLLSKSLSTTLSSPPVLDAGSAGYLIPVRS